MCEYTLGIRRPDKINIMMKVKLSEWQRDLVNKATGWLKQGLYYGWIPFIVMIGIRSYIYICLLDLFSYFTIVGFWNASPRPSVLRIVNPLG